MRGFFNTAVAGGIPSLKEVGIAGGEHIDARENQTIEKPIFHIPETEHL
jgi:hypothetical protein